MIEHKLPGTYMFKNMVDISLFDPVSWYPQTIGWKVLGVLILVLLGYFSWKIFKKWQMNLYRREALFAINQLNLDNIEQSSLDLFIILKAVIRFIYIYENRAIEIASVKGEKFLMALDNLYKLSFNSDLGIKWQKSLFDQNSERLSNQELSILVNKAKKLIKKHQQLDFNPENKG